MRQGEDSTRSIVRFAFDFVKNYITASEQTDETSVASDSFKVQDFSERIERISDTLSSLRNATSSSKGTNSGVGTKRKRATKEED